MPTYEYQCEDCGHKFECIVTRSKRDNVKCIKCGLDNVERLLCAAQFNMGSASTGAQNFNSCSSCNTSSCKTCK
jgi:putative FmdB family regulatory protein